MPVPIDIVWVVHATDEIRVTDPAEFIGSAIASQRLRVALPSVALNQAGFNQQAATLQSDSDLRQILELHPRLVIFSKVLGAPELIMQLERHVQLARALHSAQIPALVDICDNPYLGFAAHYVQQLIALSTHVTVNSPAMADMITSHPGINLSIINDPVEGIRHTPHFKPPRHSYLKKLLRFAKPQQFKILWFGGPLRSFESLRFSLPILHTLAKRLPVDLHLVSAPFPEIQTEIDRINGFGSTNLNARFTRWSRLALAEALEKTDLVFLPGEAGNPEKMGVSTNRLTESIWAGRVVVANGMPSYWHLKEGAFIGDDLASSIKQVLRNPAHALQRIKVGQKIVAEHYTPDSVGKAWRTLCTELINR